MRRPNTGEYRFAEDLFATEMRARRKPAQSIWNGFMELAFVTSFLFFFLM